MRSAWVQAVGYASSALLLPPVTTVSAFVVQHVPANLVSSRPGLGGKLAAVSSPTSRRPLGTRSSTDAARCKPARGGSRDAAGKLSMAFDLGEIMGQIMGSMNGNGGGNGGGGESGGGPRKGVVYDAAIVGYGPAGGVMVSRLAFGCALCSVWSCSQYTSLVGICARAVQRVPWELLRLGSTRG